MPNKLELNKIQKSFIAHLADGVAKVIEAEKLDIKKRTLSVSDADLVKALKLEVSDERTIVDNMSYVEYELVAVSQRIFERPIANQPFHEMLSSDSQGSNEDSVIYKYIDYKGAFTLASDKTSANSIISSNTSAEAFKIETLSAYTEDLSLREIAVAISKGVDLPARILRAIYVSFIKTLNKIVFEGKDGDDKGSFRYSLNTLTENVSLTSSDTFANLKTAGDTTVIFDEIGKVMEAMEELGEKNDGEFTPTHLVLPVKQYALVKYTKMKNSGYFRDTVLKYIERELGLKVVSYAKLKGAGTGATDRALLIAGNPDNLFIGLPNPLQTYSDQKFDVESHKATFRTSGLVMINGNSVGYLNGI